MDIKINSNRLKNMFSYDWVKILLSIIAGILVWSLLFTMLGTRATVGEQFYFVVYDNVKTVSADKNINLLNKLQNDGVFSYDVLERSVTEIVDAGQYSASYMLNLRTSTQEGDVLIISDGRAEYVEKSDGESQSNTSNKKDPTAEIKGVINNGYLYNFETFLEEAKGYCVDNGFITVTTEDYTGYTVNEAVIERYFKTVRLKSAPNYKKTYRTDAQIAEGVKNEIKRIEAVYKNWLSVSTAVQTAKDLGKDFLWYGEKNKYDDKGNVLEGQGTIYPYGIDLYKLNEDFKDKAKIEDTWFTYTHNPEGEGDATTCEGLVMGVFNFKAHQKDLQFEALAFINYIIETYSGY